MTDIYATVAVPAASVDTARTIGIPGAGTENESRQWAFTRALTTDANGAAPATHYGSSGSADAALLALILALPGALVDYTAPEAKPPATVIADWGLHFVAEEI